VDAAGVAAGAATRAPNWNDADDEGRGPAGVVEGGLPNVNGFAGAAAAVALGLLNENAVDVLFVAAADLAANGLLIGWELGTPGIGKVKPPVAGAAGVDVLESGLGSEPGGAPNMNGGVADASANGKLGARPALIGLFPASMEGILNANSLFVVGVTVPAAPPNSSGGFGGVSAGAAEAGAVAGKQGAI
jgi:hypothetical protein